MAPHSQIMVFHIISHNCLFLVIRCPNCVNALVKLRKILKIRWLCCPVRRREEGFGVWTGDSAQGCARVVQSIVLV